MLLMRIGPFALTMAVASAVALGCQGLGARNFYDDTVADDDGGSGSDGSTPSNADASVTTPDGSVPDASTDGAADTGTDSGPPGAPRTIGGTVIGLTGSGMVLQLNGANDLTVSPADGGNVTFAFSKTVPERTAFAVTIKNQPSSPAQICNVSGGDGVAGSGNVTSVVVNCLKDKYTVGGTITGLEGSIVLENGSEKITLSTSGDFSFLTPFDDQDAYAVSIDSHSSLPEQTCTITNASGMVTGSNVTSVAIACTTKSYSVGGSVSGAGGGTVTLTNGTDSISVGDGPFTFPTKVPSNQSYAVAVAASPPSTRCTVTKETGKVTFANVSSVSVNCVPQFALVENFDGATVPVLPSGWTTTILYKSGGNPLGFYTTSTTYSGMPAAQSLPNSCFVQNESASTDIVLTSPSFTVATNTAKLSFVHTYALEASELDSTTGYDGVVLEISVGGGPFADIGNAAFTSGGYTRTIATGYDSPLTGRLAWSGKSASGWTTTTANLSLTAGQSAKIRFRLGTDKRNVVCSPACLGFRIDTLSVAN
jgi:hypothetical protein